MCMSVGGLKLSNGIDEIFLFNIDKNEGLGGVSNIQVIYLFITCLSQYAVEMNTHNSLENNHNRKSWEILYIFIYTKCCIPLPYW